MEIKEGNTVKVHYTGKFEDDKIFDSSEGKEPLTFTVGGKQVINGFETAVLGLKVGDSTTATIESKDGYGELDESLIQEVPRDQVPGEIEEGQMLQGMAEGNRPITVFVNKVNEDTVVIDANHPLAGKTLIFDIEVVDVIAESEAEAEAESKA